jgi:hypothetical protein
MNSVAARFLSENKLAEAAAFFHSSAKTSAAQFFSRLKRRVYVTPASFLELIRLFKALLG